MSRDPAYDFSFESEREVLPKVSQSKQYVVAIGSTRGPLYMYYNPDATKTSGVKGLCFAVSAGKRYASQSEARADFPNIVTFLKGRNDFILMNHFVLNPDKFKIEELNHG